MQAHSGLCFTWLIHSSYQTLLFFFIEGEGDELNQASSQQQQEPNKIK